MGEEMTGTARKPGRREGGQSRKKLVHIQRSLDALQKPPGGIDWERIRAEYENGEFSVLDICERHGVSLSALYGQRHLGGWQQRLPKSPKAHGAGGTVKAAERLKGLVERELAAIEARLGLGEMLDAGDPLRALHTLASAVQKILDIERREKTADAGDRNRLVIDEQSRLALAQRLETLARHWEASGDSGGTDS